MGIPKTKEIIVLFEFKNRSFLVFEVMKFGSHIVAYEESSVESMQLC